MSLKSIQLLTEHRHAHTGLPLVSATTTNRVRSGSSDPVAATARGRPAASGLVIADGDESLYSLAEQAGASAWSIESCRDAAKVRDRLSESTPHLILLDDEAIRPDDRGWLLERIRLQAPLTFVIYVAAITTPKPKSGPGHMASITTCPSRSIRIASSKCRRHSSRPPSKSPVRGNPQRPVRVRSRRTLPHRAHSLPWIASPNGLVR